MSLASAGAFAIGEYAEGVAVMLFYLVGEFFSGAGDGAFARSIAGLMNLRPDCANVWRNGVLEKADPSGVSVGETIVIKPAKKSRSTLWL